VHEHETHGGHKRYSLHAPEVVCIATGKARQRYEFGSKVGVVTPLKQGWVLSCQSFGGSPYDGHTLAVNVANAVSKPHVPVILAAVGKG
jgi:IS5 family transposase